MSRCGRRVTALAAAGLLAVAPGCSGLGAGHAFDDLVADFVEEARATGGRVGVVVADAGNGAVLAGFAADEGFAPASNQKLVTGAVALLSLGPDFRLRTELSCSGEVRDGTLAGDLVLRGFGDPTLGTSTSGHPGLDGFVAAVKALGVRRIDGRVAGDGSWLGRETLGRGWQWDYLDEPYAAPFGGLCCHGNVVTLRVRPAAAGAPQVDVSPTGSVAVQAAVEQAAAGSPVRLSARRWPGGDTVLLTGSIAADAGEQVIRVAVRDPAAFAAASLASALASAGIAVDGGAARPGDRGERLVHTQPSPAVAELLRTMLRDSDNLHAEQLWRAAAKCALGDGGSESAERHGKDVLARLGVDVEGLVLADGSGLSRRNLLRPGQVASLLCAMHRSPHRDAWLQALPVAGTSGTLQRRLTDGPARGRVRAKTGTIARVVCLSGYVDRAGSAPIAFSVLWNDFTCPDEEARAVLDRFVQGLASLVRT